MKKKIILMLIIFVGVLIPVFGTEEVIAAKCYPCSSYGGHNSCASPKSGFSNSGGTHIRYCCCGNTYRSHTGYYPEAEYSDEGWHKFTCAYCSIYYRNQHTETRAATCTEAAYCSVCGSYYGSSLGHDYSKACSSCGTANVICSRCGDELSHTCHTCNYSNYKVITAATCTTDGLGRWSCSCGAYYDVTITKTGHSWADNGDCNGEKCSNCGSTTGSTSHSYGSYEYLNSTYHRKKCSNSGCRNPNSDATHTPKTHWEPNGGGASATHDVVTGCTTCNTSEIGRTKNQACTFGSWGIDANNSAKHYRACNFCNYGYSEAHTWGNGTVSKNATCTTAGKTDYSCTKCPATKTENLPAATGHTFGTKSATSTYLKSAGNCTTGAVYYYKCNNCSESSEGDTNTTYTVAAPGHSYPSLWSTDTTITDCTNSSRQYKKCNNCTHKIYQAGTHSWPSTWSTNPNEYCDSYYRQYKKCQNTGCTQYTYQASTHSMSSSVTTDPTCTKDGVRTHTCSNCSYKYTEAEPKLGHNYSLACTTCGTTQVRCSRCGDVKDHVCDITKPSISVSDVVYPNSASVTVSDSQSGVASWKVTNSSGTTITSGTTAGTHTVSGLSVGTYTVSCTDKAGNTATATFKVTPKLINKPTKDTTSFTYNGNEQTYIPVGFDSGTMNIAGNKRTDAGSQTVTVTLNNSNYRWADDNSTAAVTFTFTIAKKPISIPSTTNRIYDGSTQTGITSTTTYTVGGDYSAINAGTYTATVTPTSNYQWTNNQGSGSKNVSWTISPMTINVTWGNTSLVYNGSAQKPTVTTPVAGGGSEKVNLTVSGAQTNVGTYTATASISSVTNGQAKASNYTLSNDSTTFNITRKPIASVPTVSDKTYNGSTQTALSNTIEYTVGGTTSAIDVGTYTATVTPTSNYMWSDNTITAKNVQWKINKKSIAVSWETTSFVYNGLTQVATVKTPVDGVNGEKLNIGVSGGKIDVGTYTATASMTSVTNGQAKTSNYTLTNTTTQFTITEKPIAVTWGSTTSFVYNGVAQAPTVTTPVNGVNGEKLNLTVSGAQIDVGSYTAKANISSVTGGQAKTTNYKLTGDTKDFNITQKPIAKPQTNTTTFTYNGVTQTYTPVGFDSTTMSISGHTRIDAGSQTVTVSITDKKNYKWADDNTTNDITFTFTIGKKPIAVTWGSTTSFVYNGSAQAPTVTTPVNGVNGEKLNLTVSGAQINVGSYTAKANISSVTGGQAKTTNYQLTGDTKDFNITQKPITKPQTNTTTFIYNASTQTYTPVGFDSTTMSISGHTRIDAGSQTVTVSITDKLNHKWADDNTTNDVTFTFTINKKSIAVIWGSKTSFVYNGSAQAPTVTTPVNGAGAEKIYLAVSGAKINVGTGYIASASMSSVTGGQAKVTNYTLTNSTKSFDITPKTLTVTPISGQNKIFGEADPSSFTYTYEGNVTGQTPGFDGKLSRVDGENVGNYAILLNTLSLKDNGTFLANNYKLKFTENINFTINPKPVTNFAVTLDQTVFIYDGTFIEPEVTVKDGSITLIKGTDYTVAYTNNKNVNQGSEIPTVTITGIRNYSGTTSRTFTINKRPLTVTPVEGQHKIFGEIDPKPFKYTYSGNVTNETPGFDGELSRDEGENIGKYQIRLGSLVIIDNGSFLVRNYELKFDTKVVNFTINAKSLNSVSISLAQTVYTYNGKPINPAVIAKDGSITMVLNQDYIVTYQDNIDAITWTVTITGINNYCDTVTRNFTINQKEVTVKWEGETTYVYDGNEHAPIPSVESGVEGETIILTRTTAINVGTYTSTASMVRVDGGQKLTSNYKLANATISFTIIRADITPTVNMTGYEYDGPTLPTPTVNGNKGNGLVTYYYNTSNSALNGTNWANVTDTKYLAPGAYWMYAVVDQTQNYNGATSPTVKFFVGRAPIVTIDSNTVYAKSQTATITIYDPDKDLANTDNDKYLAPGTIRVYYEWTQTTEKPTTYSDSITINVPANTSTVTGTITKNTDSGIWYLHIKTTASDMIGYTSTTEINGTFYLDNTPPTVTTKFESITDYVGYEDTCTITIVVTDIHSGTESEELTVDDLNIFVGGVPSEAKKELAHISEKDGVHTYTLTLSELSGDGYVTITGGGSAITDRAGNESLEIKFDTGSINVFVDNTDPVIDLNGEIDIRSVTTGANLSGVLDERYINKEYEIEIPIRLIEVGSGTAPNELEASDIKVYVGGELVTPTIQELELELNLISDNRTTRVKTYTKHYVLVLKGIEKDGYLSIEIASGAVNDEVGNTNETKTYEPYTELADGSTSKIYVDNTIPRLVMTDASVTGTVTEDTEIELKFKLTDLGAGIREDQFTIDDVKVQVDGVTVADVTMVLIPDGSNNYETALGGDVPSNYTYTLKLSGVKESGTLRIAVDANQIIDKANNGNEHLTIPTGIIIDNEGPKIGELIVKNLDEHGRIVDDPVDMIISNCTDASGIKEYIWEYSPNGTDWIQIKVDENSGPESELKHQLEENGDYYFRVTVVDKLGNETTSNVVKVEYSNAQKRKPTIRFETEQTDSESVIIIPIIKSTAKIVEIKVNGSIIDPARYEETRVNHEYTTTLDYEALVNGSYTFEVTDKNGEKAKGTINIATLDETDPEVEHEIVGATVTSKAQIIFTANEPVRIKEPEKYDYLVFDTTDFKTTIIATLSGDEGLPAGTTIFEFENRSYREVEEPVVGPITNKVLYVRFWRSPSSTMDVTIREALNISNQLVGARAYLNGKFQSYYGFTGKKPQITLASDEDLNVASILAGNGKRYSLTTSGKAVELASTTTAVTTDNSSYINGNVTGMHTQTSGSLSIYKPADESMLESSVTYRTFRVKLIP